MATKPLKPVTEFQERCDTPSPWGRGPWLGISRLSRIPDVGWPQRADCQKAVTAEEKAAGENLISEYRKHEQTARDHDADARQLAMDRLSMHGGAGSHGFEKNRLRKEQEGCCRETFLNAQNRLTELRAEAAKLVAPIFERLVSEFDKQLNAIALQREEELTAMGIALFADKENDHGDKYRDYTIYSDPIVTGWQVRREVVRHSSLNVSKDNAIGCVQFLCGDEEGIPFSWL